METPPPPPLPKKFSDENVKQVKRAVFKESMRMRLGNVSFDFELIEKAHKKALEWINQNPSVEIIQIETFHSSLHGITVVWYR